MSDILICRDDLESGVGFMAQRLDVRHRPTVQSPRRLGLLEFGAKSPSAPLSVLIVLVASRMACWRCKLSRLSSRTAFRRNRALELPGWPTCRRDRLDWACRRRSAISVRRSSRSALPSWFCRVRQRKGSCGCLRTLRSARSIRVRARCARSHCAAESLTQPRCPDCSPSTPVGRDPSAHAADRAEPIAPAFRGDVHLWPKIAGCFGWPSQPRAAEPAVVVSPGDSVHPTAAGSRP
jgi:hypothetical protein